MIEPVQLKWSAKCVHCQTINTSATCQCGAKPLAAAGQRTTVGFLDWTLGIFTLGLWLIFAYASRVTVFNGMQCPCGQTHEKMACTNCQRPYYKPSIAWDGTTV